MAQRHAAAMAAKAESAHLAPPVPEEVMGEEGVPVPDDAPADSNAWGFLRRMRTSRAHLEASDAKVAGEFLDLTQSIL